MSGSQEEEAPKRGGYRHFLCPDFGAFVHKAAKYLAYKINRVVEEKGFAVVGLSNGPGAQEIYRELSKNKQIEWRKVYVFAVDEKHQEGNTSESTVKLIQSTILKTRIPEDHAHLPDRKLPIDLCVEDYAEVLKRLKGAPDVVVLWVAEDASVAGLFPPLSNTALGTDETVLHTQTRRFDCRDRVSVSLRVLNSAENTVVLLPGDKVTRQFNEMVQERKGNTQTFRKWPLLSVLHQKKGITVIGTAEQH